MLESLAYKKMASGIWAKPVGNCLFVYNPDNREWLNCFMDVNGKLAIYERHRLENNASSLETFLRNCEAGTRINWYTGPLLVEDWEWL